MQPRKYGYCIARKLICAYSGGAKVDLRPQMIRPFLLKSILVYTAIGHCLSPVTETRKTYWSL